jgi:hypothetical protein
MKYIILSIALITNLCNIFGQEGGKIKISKENRARIITELKEYISTPEKYIEAQEANNNVLSLHRVFSDSVINASLLMKSENDSMRNVIGDMQKSYQELKDKKAEAPIPMIASSEAPKAAISHKGNDSIAMLKMQLTKMENANKELQKLNSLIEKEKSALAEKANTKIEEKVVTKSEPKVEESSLPKIDGISYRIQLGSFGSFVPEGFSGTRSLMSETVTGTNIKRYLIGDFKDLLETKKVLEGIKKLGISAPIILEYKDGVRMKMLE